MNILIPISWLKEFLKTEASAEKIAETLSLCSQSVEKIHKIGKEDVLEIEITVNRYDCLSIIGIAREAAAVLPQFNNKARFVEPKIPAIPLIKKESLKNKLNVQIEDSSICPRFTAILIEEVKIAPSPKWLIERLNSVGIRSLNNVVDISNYLMVETGQPIHTFDFDKILGQKMIMRLSKKGEKVVTLDGVQRTFEGGDIVIEDGKGRIIDLCGIMGGQNSEISQNTKRVLFFVQAYDPVRIRKTSMSLGLRTEAAVRFERGIDLEGILPVISRGIEMMSKIAYGKVGGKLIDIYPQKQIIRKIAFNYNFIKERFGFELDNKKISDILESLGFRIISQTNLELKVIVPTWRTKDIQIEEDLLEEVARIYGYFRFPSKIPRLSEDYGLISQTKPKKGSIAPFFQWEEKAKDILKAFGFSETYNLSFVSDFLIRKCNLNPHDHLRIKNPLTSDLEYLRISLVPSLLSVYLKNIANFPQIKIFEMANFYLPKKDDLPEENFHLIGLANCLNFYQLKGTVLELLRQLGIVEVEVEPVNESFEPFLRTAFSAKISYKNKLLGVIGEISNEVIANFNIGQKIHIFDLNFDAVSSLSSDKKIFIPIPKFPPIIEDLCFTFPDKTAMGNVIQFIKVSNPLIKNAELIDSFDKTRTFRIIYQHLEKSLTDGEVENIRGKVIKKVESQFKASLKQLT